MDVTKLGRIVGPFLEVYAQINDPRFKKKLAEGIEELMRCWNVSEELQQEYQMFCEGLISARTPLRLINLLVNLLPGQPMITEDNTAPIGEPVFFLRRDKGTKTSLFYGANPNGKVLIKAMVEVVRAKVAAKQTQ